jgi:hypothetical protein
MKKTTIKNGSAFNAKLGIRTDYNWCNVYGSRFNSFHQCLADRIDVDKPIQSIPSGLYCDALKREPFRSKQVIASTDQGTTLIWH